MPNAAQVILQLQSTIAPQIAGAVQGFGQVSAAEQKAAQSAAVYTRTLLQVAQADQKVATEAQRTAVQTATAAKASDQAALAALRLKNAQDKVASGNSFAAQTAAAFKSQIVGVIGPLALVTTAFATAKATLDSFVEAFKFKAALDATTASVKSQLDGFRDVGQTYAEAAAFGRQYNITQEQTNSILQSSVGSLRSSTAGVAQLETALIRLQSKDVSKPISEAARALAELESGDVTSIKELFRVSAKDALGMRDAIAAGGDSVQVLTAYLDRTQTGMHALELRAQGVQGALNRAQIAQEDLTLAQAKFAEGPGTQFTEFWTNIVKETTAILSGDFTEIQARNQARIAGQQAYDAALRDGKDEATAYAAAQAAIQQITTAAAQATTLAAGAYNAQVAAIRGNIGASETYGGVLSAETQKKLDSQIATAALAAEQAQLDSDSKRAAQGLLGAGDQALLLAEKYRIAASDAQFLIDQQQKLSNATALADQRKGEQTGTDLSARQFNTFSDLAHKRDLDRAAEQKRINEKAASDAARLTDAQNNLNLSRAKTSAQKIAELRRQQAATSDPVEKLQLQAQIEQEQKSGAGRITAAESTALRLNDIARKSGDDRARIERENQEKLRDAQLEFDVRRSRAEEDYQEKRRKLLTSGYKAQSAQVKSLDAEFAKDQRRGQEDFGRQNRRTVRNNAEALGDQSTRVGNSVESVNARTAARGGAVAGLPSAPGAPGAPGAGGPLGALPSASSRQPASLVIQGVITLDGKAVGTGIWPTIEVLVDQELAVSLQAIGVPGSGQSSVGGAG